MNIPNIRRDGRCERCSCVPLPSRQQTSAAQLRRILFVDIFPSFYSQKTVTKSLLIVADYKQPLILHSKFIHFSDFLPNFFSLKFVFVRLLCVCVCLCAYQPPSDAGKITIARICDGVSTAIGRQLKLLTNSTITSVEHEEPFGKVDLQTGLFDVDRKIVYTSKLFHLEPHNLHKSIKIFAIENYSRTGCLHFSVRDYLTRSVRSPKAE